MTFSRDLLKSGSFNFGNNRDDMSSLVTQGLAVFNIAYRLGPYGFLNMDETEPGQRHRGNWGLLDQQAALKWISMYGGVFGGDKNRVTLDGCSAGSQSAWHHLTSESSWPYFHQVVSNGLGLAAGSYYEGWKTDVSYFYLHLVRYLDVTLVTLTIVDAKYSFQ